MTSFQCIVIGSGNAGCCAAFSAAEAGCDKGAFRTVHEGVQDLVAVVDKASAEQAGSIDMDPYTREEFLGDIMRLGDGKPDPVLAGAVVDASRDTVTWLATKIGLPFMFSFHRQAYNVGGRQKFWGGLVLCTDDGGKGLIAAHHRALAKAGVDVWFNCPALEITMENGAVSGVVVQKDGERMHLRSPAVVLAAGGFEGNPQLREKYLGPGWERAILRGTGDGFKLAAAVGARQTGDWAGCHSTCWDADAPKDGGERNLTNQFTKSGYPLGIMVNSAGKRFVDEGEDYRNYTYAKFGKAIQNQPGSYVFQVWDSKAIGMLRKEEYGDGIVKKIFADSIEELAEKLSAQGLEAKQEFVETVNEFNAAVKDFEAENLDSTWNPAIKDGMSTQSTRMQLSLPKSNWALTIDQAPFMAVKVACGITFTFGGLAIDPETAGVISEKESKVIPGLFCTGEMVGLFHKNYPGGSGLTAGAVFGRKAGQAAAKLVVH
ncbi:FAD/NAD(P)-binding domain-containing protein [Mycena sanguinolenta]|uniref:FAD/NAD(P)-binding domain-containing protein n=1 Tax=Mycena sanguinolenta TaxID=230812 RepID=A0A8H7CQ76_9AGAR|nr:FAD/NAD(P)-binding domain-containing protein [Mycena sanguinolenta]